MIASPTSRLHLWEPISLTYQYFYLPITSSHTPCQCGDDWLIQQLLPDVWPRPKAGYHFGGFPGKQQAHAGSKAPQSVCRWQTQEGRNQRGQFGLQQEDPSHCVASPGQHHRSCDDQQPLHISGQSKLTTGWACVGSGVGDLMCPTCSVTASSRAICGNASGIPVCQCWVTSLCHFVLDVDRGRLTLAHRQPVGGRVTPAYLFK